MSSPLAFRKLILSLFLSLLGACAWGAPSESKPAPVGSEKNTPAVSSERGFLRLELVAQTREAELPSRFNVALRLINSSTLPVVFKEFRFRPLEEAGGLQVTDECSKLPQHTVSPNEAYVFLCEISSPQYDDSLVGFLYSMMKSWSLLTFTPGEYRFVAVAEIRSADSISYVTETIGVRIRPTVWQICCGAALGAGLLVVFLICSSKLQAKVSGAVRPTTRGRAAQLSSTWLGAVVSSWIFVFMTYRLKDVAGPFTVSVNDFYGGVVIGIFGIFLAEWLGGKLFK
jgi:hypothetical protein